MDDATASSQPQSRASRTALSGAAAEKGDLLLRDPHIPLAGDVDRCQRQRHSQLQSVSAETQQTRAGTGRWGTLQRLSTEDPGQQQSPQPQETPPPQ
jgi:hypothetical protein